MTDDAPERLDLVGTTEIATRCEVDPATVRSWRVRGNLPDPEWVIGRVPIWRWPTVAACPTVYRHLYELAQRPPPDPAMANVVGPGAAAPEERTQ